MNIYEGTLSLGQVEAFVCEPLEDKTIKPFSRYGDFKTKAHPETGEALTATRAYKNKDVFRNAYFLILLKEFEGKILI